MDENLSKNKISERKQKRREMLAGYFFDLSKLMCSGVVVGGLSPLFTGDEMGIFNYLFISFGFTATVLFAYFGNEILKVKLK